MVDVVNVLKSEDTAFFVLLRKIWNDASRGFLFYFSYFGLVEKRESIRKKYTVARLLNCLMNFNELLSVRGIISVLLYLSLDENKSSFKTIEFWDAVKSVFDNESLNSKIIVFKIY
jgi:hypothetical protein